MRMLTTRTLSAITGIGVSVFVLVVVLLHLLQPSYDPLSQLMSELALGHLGGLLVIAFLGLSVATVATAANVWRHKASFFLSFLLGFSAASFFAAGIITLAMSAQIHVLFVAVAFVACGLSMYLLPRVVPSFTSLHCYVFSWGSCLVMCVVTGLGGSLILPGIAQRISALVLLFWLSFVAWRLGQ
jgi:hypothetical protein